MGRAVRLFVGLLAGALGACGCKRSNLAYNPSYLVSDLDGDGRAEVLSLEMGRTGGILLRSADGSRVELPGKVAWALASETLGTAPGDVDGDGEPEALHRFDPGEELRGRIGVRSGGTGELLWTESGDRGDHLGIRLAHDVDGDGVRDVLATDVRGRLRAYAGATGELVFESTWSPDGKRAVASDLLVFERDPAAGGALLLLTDRRHGRLHARSIRDGPPVWSAALPVFEEQHGSAFWNLVPIGDQDGDGVVDVLVGATFEHGALACSGVDGDVIRQLPREHFVPLLEFGARYDPGSDLDGDGVDDFVVNLGSYYGPPERDCSYAYSGRDLSLLRKLR